MKIAYVCADLGVPVFGYKGCSIHVQEVIRAFKQLGATVTLITPRLGGNTPFGLEGVKVIQLPDQAFIHQSEREVHAHQLNDGIWMALQQAGPFDMVYERYSLWSYAAMEYAKQHTIPGLLEVNAPLIEEQAQHRQLINRVVAETVARRVFSATTNLIAVSAGVADYLNGFEEAFGRVVVIGNGVNLERFYPSSRAQLNVNSEFIIGFVGTLKPWHGLHVLVDAFAHLRKKINNARLLIVGDGPERKNVEKSLRQHNLAHAVHFTGAVASDEIPSLLSAMNTAVAPYPDSEQFYFSPLKVLEYMAAGLPVVASRIGQLNSLIQHGRNGLLCEPGQPHDLSITLQKLAVDANLCYQLGQQARRSVEKHHSWQTVSHKILALAGYTHIERRSHAT